MTLDQLQQIEKQLQAQYATLLASPITDVSKITLMHCNAIEIRGALQLLGQLVLLEQQTLAAPPGATGPIL